MNQPELVSLIVMLAVCVTMHFATRALATRLRPVVRPWIEPIIHRFFPGLKLEAWLFEPIAGPDLPPWQREFFNAHTTAFLARHYTPLGDFVLRRDREPSCVRLFLSPDRAVIGELSCFLGERVIGAMSVLFDGTYIETSTSPVHSPPPKGHGLRFFSHRTRNALDLLDHHAACMAGVTAENLSQPTVLLPSDFQAVMNYGRQLSLRSLHQQGVLEELPEFLLRKDASAAGVS
jgi:hypothetical protein